MLSRVQDHNADTTVPARVRWSGRRRRHTLAGVPKGTAAERSFRRRLGAALAEIREAAGLTQEEVAGDLKIDAETIGRWERGAFSPNAYNLARLAKHYGMSDEVKLALFSPPAVPTSPIRKLLGLARGAAAAGLQDEEETEEAPGPGADEPPDGSPDRP